MKYPTLVGAAAVVFATFPAIAQDDVQIQWRGTRTSTTTPMTTDELAERQRAQVRRNAPSGFFGEMQLFEGGPVVRFNSRPRSSNNR